MTESILIIGGIFLLFLAIFILTHLRPLTVVEIKTLAALRRKNQIRFYYTYGNNVVQPDKDFKKRMNSEGKFYRVDVTLSCFPSTVAALLKYKKHEWIIIGFEKDMKVDLMWLNKGFNRASVSSNLTLSNIIYTAKLKDYTSVLILHNHPNWNPNYYNFKKPSEQDLHSANELMKLLNPIGLNLVEFVCERGVHHEYFISTADTFYPVTEYVAKITSVNNQKKSKNLALHFERVFQI